MNRRTTGTRYEELAASYLASHGAVVLERNFRSRSGEIDLICRDGTCLVFAEVKYRASKRYGEAMEAVSAKKQRTIIRVAQFYLLKHGYPSETPVRFDVIALDTQDNGEIRIQWLRDAFRLYP